MKNIFILLFLISNIAFGQPSWTLVNSGTNKNLHNMQFISANIGFIVGDSGTVLKTIDNGNSWSNLSMQNDLALVGVSFLNDTIGYVISEHNVYKTIDGGINWRVVFNDTVNSFASIKFLSEQVGFIGTQSSILKTINGAINWNSVLSTNYQIKSISFTSSNIGYFTGGAGPNTNVFKTINQGQSFTTQLNPSNTVAEEVFFINDSVGYVIGWYVPSIHKTINGGITWQVIDTQYVGGQAIHFINEDIGFHIDNSGGTSKIFSTLNGGAIWINELTLQLSNLYALQKICSSQSAVFTIGINGIIYKRNTTVGINNSSTVEHFKVYPNPTHDILNIQHLNNNETEYVVYNLVGKQLLKGKVFNHKIDMTILPQGEYFMELKSEKHSKTYKIIKQ